MRGQDDPHEFLLTIGGLHPTLLDGGLGKLVEDVVVLGGEADGNALFLSLVDVDLIDVVRVCHRVTRSDELTRSQKFQRAEVVPAVSELLDVAVEIGRVDIHASMPATEEVQRAAVTVPDIVIDIGVELLGDIAFLACGKVHDTEPVAVALIAVVLHALPGNVFAVGRELRIDIVAYLHVTGLMVDSLVAHGLCRVDLRLFVAFRLAEVASRARTYII